MLRSYGEQYLYRIDVDDISGLWSSVAYVVFDYIQTFQSHFGLVGGRFVFLLISGSCSYLRRSKQIHISLFD